jgi:hypothetical protein
MVNVIKSDFKMIHNKSEGYWNFAGILERVREIEHLPLLDEEIEDVLWTLETSIQELQYIQSILQTHTQNKNTDVTNHSSS